MNHLEFSKGFAAPLAGLMAVGWPWPRSRFGYGPAASSAESGPLEWAQEAALLAAIVFSGAARARTAGPERLAAYLATLLYLVFFLRELELPVSGLTTGYLASDAFRRHEHRRWSSSSCPMPSPAAASGGTSSPMPSVARAGPSCWRRSSSGVGAALDGAPGVAGVPHLGTFHGGNGRTPRLPRSGRRRRRRPLPRAWRGGEAGSTRRAPCRAARAGPDERGPASAEIASVADRRAALARLSIAPKNRSLRAGSRSARLGPPIRMPAASPQTGQSGSSATLCPLAARSAIVSGDSACGSMVMRSGCHW